MNRISKRALKRAARLHTLALAAWIDAGVAQTKEEAAVLQATIAEARAKLSTLGLTVADVITVQDCITLAKRYQ